MADSRSPFSILKAVPESLAGPAVAWTPVAAPPATAAPPRRPAGSAAGPREPAGRGPPSSSGQRPADLAVSGQRPADLAVSGQRPADLAVSGQRPADLAVSGQRPADLAVSGQRPAGLAASGPPLQTHPSDDGVAVVGRRTGGGRCPPAAVPATDVGVMPSEAAMRRALRRGADTDRRALSAIVRLLDERAVLQQDLAQVRAERDALAAELDAHRRATARHRKAMLSVLDDVARFFARRGLPACLPAPACIADAEPDLLALLGPRQDRT